MPEYNFNYLLEKWPCRDPECISDNFHNEPYDDNIKLSFIIPLYNSSMFVERLYHQLVSQRTKYKYEIIFVNDGSRDNTDEKIRALITNNDSIKYISQENQGIGGARNTGLDNARGEYIAFVDHDDEVAELFVEKVLNAAYENNADVVKCCYCAREGDIIFETANAKGYIMGGVYRRTIFQRVRFPAHKYWYEDMINVFLMYPQANFITNIHDILYYKNTHSKNATKVYWSSEQYQCLEQIYLPKFLIDDYHKLGLKDDDYLSRRVLTEFSTLAVFRTYRLDDFTRKQIFLACHEILSSFKHKPSGLSWKEEIFYNAIIHKDFKAWNLAARV